MSKNLEIETKVMINEEAYKQLQSSFNQYKTYKQTNYYIGSKEFIKKNKQYGLRIRKKENRFELTLKVKELVGKTEINQDISRIKFLIFKVFHIFPNGEVKNYLLDNNVCDVKKLKPIGKMVTYRKDIPQLTSLISIDKSVYLHTADFEIECEDISLESSKQNLALFLKSNNIDYKKSECGKLARFLARKY